MELFAEVRALITHIDVDKMIKPHQIETMSLSTLEKICQNYEFLKEFKTYPIYYNIHEALVAAKSPDSVVMYVDQLGVFIVAPTISRYIMLVNHLTRNRFNDRGIDGSKPRPGRLSGKIILS